MSTEKFLDISSRLGKVRQRVHLVGLELEGGWKKLPQGTNQLHTDSSVQFPEFAPVIDAASGFPTTNPAGPKHVGELCSSPMAPEKVSNWLKQHYPSHVNGTCGLHVHMSFNNALKYQRLMEEQFMWTVIEFLDRWSKRNLPPNHCIFERLEGKSEYCQHKFFPDAQARFISKEFNRKAAVHRYTVLNYAFHRFGTIECRLLPMMPTVELAEDVINELVNITSAYLFQTAIQLGKKGEQEIISSWQLKNTKHQEDIIECV